MEHNHFLEGNFEKTKQEFKGVQYTMKELSCIQNVDKAHLIGHWTVFVVFRVYLVKFQLQLEALKIQAACEQCSFKQFLLQIHHGVPHQRNDL